MPWHRIIENEAICTSCILIYVYTHTYMHIDYNEKEKFYFMLYSMTRGQVDTERRFIPTTLLLLLYILYTSLSITRVYATYVYFAIPLHPHTSLSFDYFGDAMRTAPHIIHNIMAVDHFETSRIFKKC